MRTRAAATRAIGAIVAACLCCSMLPGCKGEQKRRATVEFHTKGVRLGVDRVRGEIDLAGKDRGPDRTHPGQNTFYSMKIACEHLARALDGLPERIQKKATTRVSERRAVAEKAVKLFAEMRPELLGLKYDKEKMRHKLDVIVGMMDEIDKP